MLGDVPPPVIGVVPVLVQLPPRLVQTITINQDGIPVIHRVLVPGGTVIIPGAALPTARGFKIADDGSARPQDRVFLDFNFFSDLLASSNVRLGTTIQNLNLYRESLGVEKTFLDRTASVGLHLPLDTVTLESTLPNLNGTHTALGDLSAPMIIGSARAWRSRFPPDPAPLPASMRPPSATARFSSPTWAISGTSATSPCKASFPWTRPPTAGT